MIRRGAGRGHVPGRHQAGDRAPSDRRRARRPDAGALRQLPAGARQPPIGAGRVAARRGARGGHRARRRDRAQRGARDAVAAGRQPRRSADPGRQPLSLRRDQPRARVRPRRGLRTAASTSPPARRSASSRARRRPSRWSRSPATGSFAAATAGRRSGDRRGPRAASPRPRPRTAVSAEQEQR